MPTHKPLVLLILDGWGYREASSANAIAQAQTPQWDTWWANCPHGLLEASNEAVGLPKGQMGNSEVGHMHIGAGRVIPQDFTRINDSIEDGSFFHNPILTQALESIKNNQTLHIMGLLSPGGVHSHEAHLFALLECCKKYALKHVKLHLFLDGRDVSPQHALQSLEKLHAHLYPSVQIVSLCGRYYAMDRNKNWERIASVFTMLTEGTCAHHFSTPTSAIESFYAQQITDEFIPPTCIGASSPIKDQDSVLFFNFRADRARQLTEAFIDPQFMGFDRKTQPKLNQFLSMTTYGKHYETQALFPPIHLKNTLGEVIAKAGLRQLRIAETEKYAHVTFFLNGGQEQAFAKEDRILIPSPNVATYDLCPAMSAPLVTDQLIAALENDTYDVMLCNYANADMVGHTGNLNASIQAIECLDHCMQRIGKVLQKKHGQLLITADHGNVEMLYDTKTAQAHTAHTRAPVPFLFVGEGWKMAKKTGTLIDIAPTIFALMGLEKPEQMTGQSLLVKS